MSSRPLGRFGGVVYNLGGLHRRSAWALWCGKTKVSIQFERNAVHAVPEYVGIVPSASPSSWGMLISQISLFKARLTAQHWQTFRSYHHPSHLHCSNPSIMACRSWCFQGLSFRSSSLQFYYCHERIWQRQFDTSPTGSVAVSDTQRPLLGPDSRR